MNSLIGQAKPVVQMTFSGEQVAVFPSVKAAGEALNINRSSISRCLNGDMVHVGDYKWKYLHERDKKPEATKYCQSCRRDTPSDEQVIICLDCFRK